MYFIYLTQHRGLRSPTNVPHRTQHQDKLLPKRVEVRLLAERVDCTCRIAPTFVSRTLAWLSGEVPRPVWPSFLPVSSICVHFSFVHGKCARSSGATAALQCSFENGAAAMCTGEKKKQTAFSSRGAPAMLHLTHFRRRGNLDCSTNSRQHLVERGGEDGSSLEKRYVRVNENPGGPSQSCEGQPRSATLMEFEIL